MANSIALGNLDQELTAQNMRKLNSAKKQRRKMARECSSDITVPSIQQLAIEQNMSFSKPDLQLRPTMQTVNSAKKRQAEVIREAEQKQELERQGIDSMNQREEDAAYYEFMIGG